MRRRSWGTFSYLRQYYFDDKKLRELAVTEFVRAMRSGRLIAFTGSMTTTPYGYPTWGRLLDEALGIAATFLGSADRAQLIPTLRNIVGRGERFDARVAFSAVAQMLDQKDPSGSLTEKALKKVAALFARTSRDGSDEQGIVRALFDELHIDRVVTTNYDLELESHAMGLLAPSERGGHDLLQRIGDLKKNGWLYHEGAEDEAYSLVRNLPNGDRVVSDVMLRDRPDSLIEFAIGCPENDKHIFHLHGRADSHRNLILSYRDYDRLYRRRGVAKLPFEHALRILFAGNPVLFVGLGMTEPELNQTLSDFVGDHPYLRKTPAFLIWNDFKPLRGRRGHPAMTAQQREAAFRLDMLHRLGILTLFPRDLVRLDPPLAPTGSDAENLRRGLLRLTREAIEVQRKRLEEVPADRWRHALPRIKRGFEALTRGGDAQSRIINTWNVRWTDAPRPVVATPRPLAPQSGS